MKNLLISKVITSFEDYSNSKEVQEQFAYYAPNEYHRHIRSMGFLNFVEAYVIKTDPSENYGRNFKVFYKHICKDGLTVLLQTTAGSSLHNGNLVGMEIVDNVLQPTSTQYNKNSQGRIDAIKDGAMVI